MDKILSSLFLDDSLWSEVIDHGFRKGIPAEVLEYIQDPHCRAALCRDIAEGRYLIRPPHTGYRPKEDGGERVFFANEPLDRLVLNAICKWLMRNESGMVHRDCRSYQEGVGVGKIVRGLSARISSLSGISQHKVVGRKFDIQKYFDTIPREYIHQAFDMVEQHHGKSAVISLLRTYYDSDIYYDTRKKAYVSNYQGIKQGCAVSSWLANVILYELDRDVSSLKGYYVRYSDDIIYVGEDYEKATNRIAANLAKKGLVLNPKKIEDVVGDQFIRFLGYYIRGSEITLSPKWVKYFQNNINRLTVKTKFLVASVRNIRKRYEGEECERRLMRKLASVQKGVALFLYLGDGEYSWANLVLSVINRQKDVDVLNQYCLDALRAVYTGKTSIGGLGVSKSDGIVRGCGRHVAENRKKTLHLVDETGERTGWLNGYYSIPAMQKHLGNKWLYRALVADLLLSDMDNYGHVSVTQDSHNAQSGSSVEELERIYHKFLNSRPDGKKLEHFYARKLSDMNTRELLGGEHRSVAREELNAFIHDALKYESIQSDPNKWYWQSQTYQQLVLLKSWCKTENSID